MYEAENKEMEVLDVFCRMAKAKGTAYATRKVQSKKRRLSTGKLTFQCQGIEEPGKGLSQCQNGKSSFQLFFFLMISLVKFIFICKDIFFRNLKEYT